MSFKDTIKQWYKPFLLLFVALLLVFNWQRIVLFTNYNVLFGEIKQALRIQPSPAQEARKLQRALNQAQIPFPASETATSQPSAKQAAVSAQQNGVISIPKIGVQSPVVFPSSPNPDFKTLLSYGSVHFPGSALPGQPGASIILGHSAPAGWPRISYDWIFSDLYQLAEGDEIKINFGDQEYIYRVKQRFIIDKGDNVPISLTNNESMLILLSCWPPGKDLYRIAVEAVLIQQ